MKPSNMITLNTDAAPAASEGQRSMGAILIDAGQLRAEDAERVLRLSKETGLRFGEAAIKLGLITDDQIRKALSTQFDFPYLVPGQTGVSVSRELVAAFEPFSRQVDKLRALRTQLILRWLGDQQKMVAIASAGRGEGRSYMAANLAIVFSQLGERTLLIDADLRNPRQHALFNLPNTLGLSSVLAERADAGAIARVPGFADLSVLTSGPIPPNPQELLSRESCARLLAEASREYDVVLVDTTAMHAGDEAQMVAAHAKGVMVVVRGGATGLKAYTGLVGAMRTAGSTVVGTVLNNF